VEKQLATNTLVVAQGNHHPALFRDKLIAAEVIWINGEAPAMPLSCHAKIRYRQPDQACVISQQDDKFIVSFETPQRAVTPGQSVVFYEGEVCLGGGVIETAL
jgi:tRNA-specific 2-thiouridylase